MTSNSNQLPPKVQDLGNGISHFNYNIVEKEATEEMDKSYNYDQLIVENPVNYGKIVAALINEKYSYNDEISIIRQKEIKPAEYQEYFDFAESCKILAKDE